MKKALESRRPDGPLVLLGVGSGLRSDDAAGVRVAALIAESGLPFVHALDGGAAPENSTAEIRRISPSHLIMVDAAGMGEAPGTIRLIDPADAGGASFGTHGLPLGVLADFLTKETGCRVLIVGIQPATVEFGEELSPAVARAVDDLVAALKECLGQPWRTEGRPATGRRGPRSCR